MKFIAHIYDKVKYTSEPISHKEVTLNDVAKYEVVEMTDDQIRDLGFEAADDYGEYLIITYKSGEVGTFRNSYVDIFRA